MKILQAHTNKYINSMSKLKKKVLCTFSVRVELEPRFKVNFSYKVNNQRVRACVYCICPPTSRLLFISDIWLEPLALVLKATAVQGRQLHLNTINLSTAMAVKASTDVQLLGSERDREGKKIATLRSYLQQKCCGMLSGSYKDQEITAFKQHCSVVDNPNFTCQCKMSN